MSRIPGGQRSMCKGPEPGDSNLDDGFERNPVWLKVKSEGKGKLRVYFSHILGLSKSILGNHPNSRSWCLSTIQ